MTLVNWKPYPENKPKGKEFIDLLVTLLDDDKQPFVASVYWHPQFQMIISIQK